MVLFTVVLNCSNHDIWNFAGCPVNFLDGSFPKSLLRMLTPAEKKLDRNRSAVITSSEVSP